MAVYFLPDEPDFPPVSEAEKDGLLAIGGDLTVPWLLKAYSNGVFPWFEHEGVPYWFSPHPRMVMFPNDFKVSNSLARTIKSKKFEVRVDTAFRKVITGCSNADMMRIIDSWISKKFINGYSAFHKEGYAHSFETYYNGQLVGGLYGVSLGSAFFGESMFYLMSDASKVAFHALVEFMKKHGMTFIDCQQETGHIASLGAKPISRERFVELLESAMESETLRGKWRLGNIDESH